MASGFTEKNTFQSKVAYIGNFDVLSVGEPEIAASLKELGYDVVKIQERIPIQELRDKLAGCDWLLFAKFRVGNVAEREKLLEELKIPKVAWVFDLYWGMTHDEGVS